MRLDKDKIREALNENDIKLILKDLGSEEPKEPTGKNELHFSTVCHGGNKHKLYYYPDSKSFRCYTDCSETMDVYEIVMKARKVTFPQAVNYVAQLTGKVFTANSMLSKADSYIIDDWQWISRYQKKEKMKVDLPIHKKQVLDLFLPYPHDDWLREGISYETLKEFEIGYYCREDRITIPHFDLHHNLIGIRGRAIKEEDIEAGKKYMPLTIESKLYSFPTMFNLYGLHKTKGAITRLKKAAVFESEKSVFKCHDYYGEDNFSCATGGSSFSIYHRDILISLGVEELFLCFDKEFTEHDSEEAYKYAEKLLKIAKKCTPFMRVYILWDEWNLLDLKESPSDRGKEVLETLMKRKYEIKTKDGD